MTRHPSPVLLVLLLVGGIAWPTAPGHADSSVRRPAAGSWRIDPSRSEVRFTITKLGFDDVTGVFRESEGEIRYDPAHPESSAIQWRVRVASVLTDASNRDRALQSEQYFDAGRHPFLSFVSREVREAADGMLDVAGDITIRGVTRSLTVRVRPRVTAAGPSFETDFTIDRYQFGVVGGSTLGRLIGREARLHLLAATTK
jgi:polyisoprenoid-binding protein YceI